jgi:microcystin-dependent protein
LPNAAGGTGKAIQSFGEWVNPFPGAWSMAPSTIFNNFNANYMDFGDIDNPSVGQPRITFGNTVQPEVGFVVEVKGQFGVTQGISALQLTASEGIGASYAYLSSIRAFQSPNTGLSTLNVIPGITTSTLQVSSMVANMMSTNRAAVINDLTVGTNITSGALLTVGTNLFVTNNANVTNNVTTSNVNLQSINGLPYNVANIGMPVGSLMMWPGGSGLTGPTNVPGGYLYCDGSTYSVGAPYVALYAAIGNTWGGTPGVSFRVPDSRGRAAFGSVVDTSSGSGFAYSPQVTFQSVTVNGAPVADTNNGWYVTATTGQVYVGMTFNFAGATGTRTITKILSNNGVGDGWTVPFVVLWSSTGTANAFPVFAGSSVAALQTESTTTIAPFIGRQPSDPGATYNLQAQLGSPGQGQAIDQTSAHIHTYNLGNGRSYNVAGAPDLIANNNGQNTSVPQGLYSYNIPGGGGVSANHIMLTNPPNFGVFYYIKY